jgi:hypothetical protein
MTDMPPPEVPPPSLPASSRRRWPAALLALAIGTGGGWYLGHSTARSEADIAAEQFCALGDDDGASLFDVAGWTKAAERAADDWDDVVQAIEDQCPLWRDQIVAKGQSLDEP